MRRTVRLVSVLVIVCAAGACVAPESRWLPGALYSVWEGDESFAVVKVLAVDPNAVSVRWYRESFPDRPETASSSDLSLGTIDDEVAGLGHIALVYRDFELMFPMRIAQEDLSAEELEGYEMWKESGGGTVNFEALAEAIDAADEFLESSEAQDPDTAEELRAAPEGPTDE